MNKQIYTIGFTKKTAEEFFELIKKNNITLIIDVRLNNTSQLSGFSKFPDIKYFLKSIAKCEYISDKNFAPLEITLNRYKKNQINWDDYVKFYDDLLKNDDRFSLQVNMAGDWGGEDVKSISHDLLNVDDYIKLFNNLVRIPNSINFSFHLQELTPAEFKCYAAKKNSYTIGSDGRIYKCTEAFDMPENNLGYISKNGEMIIDYYKESCWTSISRTLNIEKCLTCKYSGCCLYSPCPKNSLQSTNKEPVCPRTKGNVANLIKILSTECFEKI